MRRILMFGTCLAAASACGSNSDSERKPDGGAGTGGGAASGGTTGTGGGVATGGTTGTGGGVATGGATGGCAARTVFAEASHAVLDVSWQAGSATMAGTGQVHLWTKSALNAAGNKLTGTVQACGTVLPPTGLSGLVGGGMILIEIPNAAWDAPAMARYATAGTQSGWDAGATVTYDYALLVGLDNTNSPTAAWPPSYTAITGANDPDGDNLPGLTALPRNGGGYVLPPTSAIGAVLGGARADKVHIVSRNVVSPTLTRTSCDEAAGTATFTHFDNHVISCHVSGGSDCDASQVKFIDDNRTVYTVGSATVKTKIVADGATCADVRAALPM